MMLGGEKWYASDLAWLRRYRDGKATPSVTGRIWEDANFGYPFTFEETPALAGVNITLSSPGRFKRSTRTDSVGSYQFDDVPPSTYTVDASLPSYEQHLLEMYRNSQGEMEVPRNGCAFAVFDMVANGVVEGLLLDHKGRPLPNVPVQAVRVWKDGKLAEFGAKKGLSDAWGKFRVEGLPSGDFEVGVNLDKRDPPVPDVPYPRTRWNGNGQSRVHLVAGEHKWISPLILPAPLTAHVVLVEVRDPDGRSAHHASVGAYIDGQIADFLETDAQGIAHLNLLEGIEYKLDADDAAGRSQSQIPKYKTGLRPKKLIIRLEKRPSDVSPLAPVAK
ncbi:MAG: carboxypeptidase-like regulatory domain-containing protein [Bryobacteraceae bacterium]